MKKGDYAVILAIAVFSVFLFVFMNIRGFEDDKGTLYVLVTVDGKEYSREKLAGTSRKIKIKTEYGENILSINNGKVRMTYSDCRDQICVKHREISKSGESIICLPNRVAVSIESDRNNEVDVVLH